MGCRDQLRRSDDTVGYERVGHHKPHQRVKRLLEAREFRLNVLSRRSSVKIKTLAGKPPGVFVDRQTIKKRVGSETTALNSVLYLGLRWPLSRPHYDLMERKVALPQYAGTKQKVLRGG